MSLEYTVSDKSAQEFARQFYLAVLTGKTIKQAFDIANTPIGADTCPLNNTPTAASYSDSIVIAEVTGNGGSQFILLPSEGDHDISIFPPGSLSDGSIVDRTPSLPPSNCDIPPRHFYGRHLEMQKVFSLLVSDA